MTGEKRRWKKAIEDYRSPRRWRVNRGFPNFAKRLGVRLPSGAFECDRARQRFARRASDRLRRRGDDSI